jgi:hypothetical protein
MDRKVEGLGKGVALAFMSTSLALALVRKLNNCHMITIRILLFHCISLQQEVKKAYLLT